MVVAIEQRFIEQLNICPIAFQEKFRKVYQQLKVIDAPMEVKGIIRIEKTFYKLLIEESRIALRLNVNQLIIGCFLFNQFYKSPEN